jgi:hypothetical protein
MVSPAHDSGRRLFGEGEGGQVEALYYCRLVPAKYYLDVLGLYLLNLLVANSPFTTNNREKIDVDHLAERFNPAPKDRPWPWGGLTDSIVNGSRRWFDSGGNNDLRDIFDFIAQTYLRLTWHSSQCLVLRKGRGQRQRRAGTHRVPPGRGQRRQDAEKQSGGFPVRAAQHVRERATHATKAAERRRRGRT